MSLRDKINQNYGGVLKLLKERQQTSMPSSLTTSPFPDSEDESEEENTGPTSLKKIHEKKTFKLLTLQFVKDKPFNPVVYRFSEDEDDPDYLCVNSILSTLKGAALGQKKGKNLPFQIANLDKITIYCFGPHKRLISSEDLQQLELVGGEGMVVNYKGNKFEEADQIFENIKNIYFTQKSRTIGIVAPSKRKAPVPETEKFEEEKIFWKKTAKLESFKNKIPPQVYTSIWQDMSDLLERRFVENKVYFKEDTVHNNDKNNNNNKIH